MWMPPCFCGTLFRLWYTLLVSFLQGYVVLNAIRQYVLFKARLHSPRYGGQWHLAPLHLYVFALIVSLSLLLFFLYFALVDVSPSKTSSFQPPLSTTHVPTLVRSLTKVPFPLLLHLLVATCLLLPLPLVQMEDIRNEALSPDSIWSTDLDFFSEHFVWFKEDSLPDSTTLRNIHYVIKSTSVSVEFVNFCVASLLIVLKMPTVFWSVHRVFSVMFSILVFSHCLTWLFLYEGVSILIKFSGTNDVPMEPLRPVSEPFSKVEYPLLLLLAILHFILTVASFFAIFTYGNTQVALSWIQNYKTFGFVDPTPKRKSAWISSVVAGGFALLVATLAISAFVYSLFFRYFQTFKSSFLVVAIIVGVVNLLLNFLVWFTFAIKTKWVFSIDFSKVSNPNESALNEGYKMAGTTDTIYGCFHNNITLSSSSSHSSGPGTMRTVEGPGSDGSGHGGNNFQNYIYMQANTLQIPTISEDFDENQSNTKSCPKPKEKMSTSTFDGSLGREMVSISDTGINHSAENLNSDSYRSLQLYGGKKYGKLVKFQGMDEETAPVMGFFDKRYSSNNFDDKDLHFLKVPDILNMNRSTMSCSHSESSIDRISSTASSKFAVDQNENGLCSEV